MQLKDDPKALTHPKVMFQFQLGAIKSMLFRTAASHLQEFQFQLGAIKRMDCFGVFWKGTGFQFQLGAIKSGKPGKELTPDDGFQFQLGAIKSGLALAIWLGRCSVSIPIRCN